LFDLTKEVKLMISPSPINYTINSYNCIVVNESGNIDLEDA